MGNLIYIHIQRLLCLFFPIINVSNCLGKTDLMVIIINGD